MKASSSMDGIVRIINDSAANTQSVSAAAEEQSAISEEMSSSAILLSDMAEKLIDEVKRFKTEA